MPAPERASSEPPVVLAVDLGTTTGWCHGRLGEAPRWGAWRLDAKAHEDRFYLLVTCLEDVLRLPPRTSVVVFEAPLPVSHRTWQTAALAWGYAAVAQYACRALNVPVRYAHLTETRRRVLGRGYVGDKNVAKAVVDRLCQARGWHIPQHDARDAFVLWQHAQLVLRPDLAPPVLTPAMRDLFAPDPRAALTAGGFAA